jgi:hypothetical protein
MDTNTKREYQLTEDDRSWAADLADAARDFARDQRGHLAAADADADADADAGPAFQVI